VLFPLSVNYGHVSYHVVGVFFYDDCFCSRLFYLLCELWFMDSKVVYVCVVYKSVPSACSPIWRVFVTTFRTFSHLVVVFPCQIFYSS